jgi:hypothetical protein
MEMIKLHGCNEESTVSSPNLIFICHVNEDASYEWGVSTHGENNKWPVLELRFSDW